MSKEDLAQEQGRFSSGARTIFPHEQDMVRYRSCREYFICRIQKGNPLEKGRVQKEYFNSGVTYGLALHRVEGRVRFQESTSLGKDFE